ncbi:hypothetical protein AGMMS4952_09930 [Spirochaetia bacterium]|nr:hypothetical protein AGMMS4952_09930 [Spirochaetia bacterium]
MLVSLLLASLFHASLVSGTLLYAKEQPAGSKSAAKRAPISQDASIAEGDFFIEQRFIQRLSWDHDPLVFRYEVILEAEQEGTYGELLRESTTANSLNLSLRPGRYRYAVEVYNLFRRLEYTMDWVYFTVLNALKPEILTFSPEAFSLETGFPRQITITVRDVDPQAVLMLRPLSVSSGEGGQGIHPVKTALEGNTARLTFEDKQLAPGTYDVYVRNPGGLEDSKGLFRVRPHGSEESGEKTPGGRSRRPDIVISAEYAPALPLYGGLFSNGVFTSPVFLPGAAIRAGVLPLKRNWGYLGAELNVSWFKMEDQTKEYTVAAQNIAAHAGVLYQLWLPKQIAAINFRLGTGIDIITDFYFDYGEGREEPLTSLYLSLDAGVSFQWHISGPFYIETGVNFSHVLSLKDRSQLGYLRPALGLTWQF